MSKVIKRSDVVKALASEPLQPGHFYNPTANRGRCNVCAVGAVVRNVFNKKLGGELQKEAFNQVCHLVTKNQYVEDDVKSLLQEGNYLGALSNHFEANYFESEQYLTPTGKVNAAGRKALIEWVEKNLPEKFTVNT